MNSWGITNPPATVGYNSLPIKPKPQTKPKSKPQPKPKSKPQPKPSIHIP